MAEDRITLEGMVFYGYHGVNPEERELGQRFVVDLELEKDLSAAGLSDDLTQTVNYASAYKLAREVVEGQPCNLIETVAERLATALTRSARKWAVASRKVRLRLLSAVAMRPSRAGSYGASERPSSRLASSGWRIAGTVLPPGSSTIAP